MMDHKANIIFETEDLIYEVLNVIDKDESKDMFALAFMDEPIGKAIDSSVAKLDLIDMRIWIDFFLDEVCSNGLSIIARDKETRQMVGVCYNMDYNYLDENCFRFYADENKAHHYLLEYLHLVGNKIKAIDPAFEKKNTVIDIWGMATHKDFRGKKIAQTLWKFSLDLIRQAGFKYACAEATSYFSKKNAQANNMECWFSDDVTKWVYRNKYILAGIEEMHKEFTFWVKKFE
jgi:GNAT superfamily N-acetyltransferase